MNKYSVILTSSIIFLCIGLFGGCSNRSFDSKNNVVNEKQIFLRLADNQNDGYITVRADREFAKKVEEKSKGRIKVDVYSGGQLGEEKSVIEQVQFGSIDLARVSVSTLSEFDKEVGVLFLPYIYKDREHMFKVLDGEIGEKMKIGLENYKLLGLCWFDAGSRNFYNNKRDITNPENLKGLKIRVQENKIMMDIVKALGASPVPMAYSEVYNALQSGVIDGAENNWLSYLSSSHYLVAKHITIDELTRIPEMIIASKINIEKLSKEDIKIIQEAAKEAADYQRQEWVKDEEDAMKMVIQKGAIITKLQDNKEFKEKIMSLYETYGKDYKELIQSIIDTK